MKSKFLAKKMKYDGTQLKPLFAYENLGILGHSIISWVGACDIHFDRMVDLEDKIENSKICGDEMLHFIIEIFNESLLAAVSLQRLFASIVQAEILKINPKLNQFNFVREGDDLYFLKKNKKMKLSISIASKSVVSFQIHFALNVVNSGTPVPTSCLSELGIESRGFAALVMKSFVNEFESILQATQKVRPLS